MGLYHLAPNGRIGARLSGEMILRMLTYNMSMMLTGVGRIAASMVGTEFLGSTVSAAQL